MSKNRKPPGNPELQSRFQRLNTSQKNRKAAREEDIEISRETEEDLTRELTITSQKIEENIEKRKNFTQEQVEKQNQFFIDTANFGLSLGIGFGTDRATTTFPPNLCEPTFILPTGITINGDNKEKYDLLCKYFKRDVFDGLPFPTTGIPQEAPPGQGYQTIQNFSPGLAVRDFMQLVLLREPRPIISLSGIIKEYSGVSDHTHWDAINWRENLSYGYRKKMNDPSNNPIYKENILKKMCRHFDFPDYGSIERRYFNKDIRSNPNGNPGIDFNLLNPLAQGCVRVRGEIVKGAQRMEYYMQNKDRTIPVAQLNRDMYYYDTTQKLDFRNMSYCIICTEKKTAFVTHCFLYIIVYDDTLNTFVTYMAGCGYYGTTEYHDLLNKRTYNAFHYGKAAIYTVDEVARLFDKTSKGKPFEYNVVEVVPLLPSTIEKLNVFLEQTDSIITQFDADPLGNNSFMKAAQHNIILKNDSFVYTQCPVIPSSFHNLASWLGQTQAKGVNCSIFIEFLFNKYISCSILGIAYPKFCRTKSSSNPYTIMKNVIEQLNKTNTTAADTDLMRHLMAVETPSSSFPRFLLTFGGKKRSNKSHKMKHPNRRKTKYAKYFYKKIKGGTTREEALNEELLRNTDTPPNTPPPNFTQCEIQFSSGPKELEDIEKIKCDICPIDNAVAMSGQP
jgi:hypothetical protein